MLISYDDLQQVLSVPRSAHSDNNILGKTPGTLAVAKRSPYLEQCKHLGAGDHTCSLCIHIHIHMLVSARVWRDKQIAMPGALRSRSFWLLAAAGLSFLGPLVPIITRKSLG